jgi:hypothetical protein
MAKKPVAFIGAEVEAAISNGDILPEEAADFWKYLDNGEPLPDQNTTVTLRDPFEGTAWEGLLEAIRPALEAEAGVLKPSTGFKSRSWRVL